MLKVRNRPNKKDFVKIATAEGIGVDLRGYPPNKMAEELYDMFKSKDSFLPEKTGNSIRLSKKDSFVTNMVVFEKGISFSAANEKEMPEAIQLLVKFLVEKTFN